jgi:hypothetical protein
MREKAGTGGRDAGADGVDLGHSLNLRMSSEKQAAR